MLMLGDKVKILGGGPLAGEEFTGRVATVEFDLITVTFDDPIMFPGNKLHQSGSFSQATGFLMNEDLDLEIDLLYIPALNTRN
jgi:hypothetical protein